jgi:hypothetical protein
MLGDILKFKNKKNLLKVRRRKTWNFSKKKKKNWVAPPLEADH